jgi:uncharacterized RDD family membrane protein YckC
MNLSKFYIRRLLSKLIDSFIAIILVSIFYPLGGILSMAYILFSDGFFDGRSIGKKILKLKVLNIKKEHRKCSYWDSVLRNAPLAFTILLLSFPILGWFLFLTMGIFIILFETYLVLTEKDGRRIGDILAHTKVIEND